ncbi:DGKA, partial [Symbiodinium necroappetens]
EAKKSSRSVAIPGVSDWRTTATDLLHVTAKAAMEKVIPRGPEARWSHRQVIPERLNQVDCRPVLVFVNTRSGGQQGFKVMTEMRNYLHTLQVVDLQREGPEAALKWWEKTGLRYRILVCGGDGTVGWVLGALYQLELAYLPPVGILPLGTGNDLARVTGPAEYQDKLGKVRRSEGWLEDLRPSWLTGGTSQVKERRLKPMVMSNYFGIGVDAAVALDFHQMRERRPEWHLAGILTFFGVLAASRLDVLGSGIPFMVSGSVKGLETVCRVYKSLGHNLVATSPSSPCKTIGGSGIEGSASITCSLPGLPISLWRFSRPA